MKDKCKAITRHGIRCKRSAIFHGYCIWHYVATKEYQREERRAIRNK